MTNILKVGSEIDSVEVAVSITSILEGFANTNIKANIIKYFI